MITKDRYILYIKELKGIEKHFKIFLTEHKEVKVIVCLDMVVELRMQHCRDIFRFLLTPFRRFYDISFKATVSLRYKDYMIKNDPAPNDDPLSPGMNLISLRAGFGDLLL